MVHGIDDPCPECHRGAIPNNDCDAQQDADGRRFVPIMRDDGCEVHEDDDAAALAFSQDVRLITVSRDPYRRDDQELVKPGDPVGPDREVVGIAVPEDALREHGWPWLDQTTVEVTITLTLVGANAAEDGARLVVDVLDNGTLQDAINEMAEDLGYDVTVESAVSS